MSPKIVLKIVIRLPSSYCIGMGGNVDLAKWTGEGKEKKYKTRY